MNIEYIKIGMSVIVDCVDGVYCTKTNVEIGDNGVVVGIDGDFITVNNPKWNGHNDGGLQDNDHNWGFLPQDLSPYFEENTK